MKTTFVQKQKVEPMVDYVERQALDVVTFLDRDGTFSDGVQWLLEYIDALPPVDAVEVVRCKNCKHAEHWYGDKSRCFLWHEGGIDVFDDGYCSYGERKDE